MVIKHGCWYKQENATGCWRDCTETQVPYHTMHQNPFLHCDSVGQKQACALRAKIGVIIIWFCLPPCSSEHCCGSFWQRPIWREAWIHPNLSHLFSEQARSLLLAHPSAPLISRAIDWNSKCWDQVVHNPAFLWIVDWMRWWWLFL